jgi:hypothetical protein
VIHPTGLGILSVSAQARAVAQERHGPPEPKPALYLAPPLMPPTSIGARRRLARQLREAALRATPPEAVDLDRLDRLVRADAITIVDAQSILTDVLRAQNERAQHAKAA